MTSARTAYEALEQQAMALDDDNDADLADRIRDVLDVIWYQRLSAEDRASLNRRGVVAPNSESLYLTKVQARAEPMKVLASVRAVAPPPLRAVGA